GIGKLVAEVPPEGDLKLTADDGRGRHGDSEEDWWGWSSGGESPAVRLSTPRTIHRKGQAIEMDLEASYAEGVALVDVGRGFELFLCESVPIHGGRGHLRLEARDDFVGPITVAAYPPTEDLTWSDRASTRTVIFPDDRELVLRARLSKKRYRPGEEASASLSL